MDIGNLYEKLEADNKCVLMTGAISFPIAFLDCWKLSPAFREIGLVQQIILAIGISFLLTLGGIMFNNLYLDAAGVPGKSNAYTSIKPIMVASLYSLLFQSSIDDFCSVFAGFGFLCIIAGFICRITAKRKKEKVSDSNNAE